MDKMIIDTIDFDKWLDDNPMPDELITISEEINNKKYSYEHIPVERVEALLDKLTGKYWDTNSFQFREFFVDGKHYISGSVELSVCYDSKHRCFVGAATVDIDSLKAKPTDEYPKDNTSFEATILSLSLCNAAKKLGNRFGRSLNGRGVGKVQDGKKEIPLPIPDKKIIEQWLELVEEGNVVKQAIYLGIYDNQTLHNALKK